MQVDGHLVSLARSIFRRSFDDDSRNEAESSEQFRRAVTRGIEVKESRIDNPIWRNCLLRNPLLLPSITMQQLSLPNFLHHSSKSLPSESIGSLNLLGGGLDLLGGDGTLSETVLESSGNILRENCQYRPNDFEGDGTNLEVRHSSGTGGLSSLSLLSPLVCRIARSVVDFEIGSWERERTGSQLGSRETTGGTGGLLEMVCPSPT